MGSTQIINKPLTLGFISLLLLAGCSKAPESADRSGLTAGAPAATREAGASVERRRFIAVAHKLVIETPEADLPKAWESAARLCQSLRCEILSSSINNKTGDSPPSGSLSLRVAPEDLSKLFDHLGKAGSVLQHATEAEDKTAVVIDVDVKLLQISIDVAKPRQGPAVRGDKEEHSCAESNTQGEETWAAPT